MTIDPTITVGNILSALLVIGTVLAAAWKISIQVTHIQWKTDMIWKWYAREHGIDTNGKDK